MTEANTPWEVTMGWSVSRKKGDFRGKDAVFARKGQEKVLMVGVVADHDDAVEGGAPRSPSTASGSASSTARPGRTG